MNIQNLEKAIKFFEDEPLRLNMSEWIHSVRGISFKTPPCGTLACLAGSACLLTIAEKGQAFYDELFPDFGWTGIAIKYFDISEEQGNKLFFIVKWPRRYAYAYGLFLFRFNRSKHSHICNAYKKDMVSILRDRVNWFIETNGTDEKS